MKSTLINNLHYLRRSIGDKNGCQAANQFGLLELNVDRRQDNVVKLHKFIEFFLPSARGVKWFPFQEVQRFIKSRPSQLFAEKAAFPFILTGSNLFFQQRSCQMVITLGFRLESFRCCFSVSL